MANQKITGNLTIEGGLDVGWETLGGFGNVPSGTYTCQDISDYLVIVLAAKVQDEYVTAVVLPFFVTQEIENHGYCKYIFKNNNGSTNQYQGVSFTSTTTYEAWSSNVGYSWVQAKGIPKEK